MATIPRYTRTGSDEQADIYNPQQSGLQLKMLVKTSAAAALFYLFCVSALAWIAFVLMFYLMGCLAAIYVLVGILPAMRAMERLAAVICTSMWLRGGPDWHVPLHPNDAPGLFDMAKRLAEKMGVETPEEIYLEMSATAAVRLPGYRTGQGPSKLYLGYEMLAVLTESELEAIIAHELAHAKLNIRAHDAWSFRTAARAWELSINLGGLITECEQQNTKFHTAALLHRCSTWIADLVSRLYSECSRQEELAADRMAALYCGSDVYSNAFIKMNIAYLKRGSINWRDRRIYTQRNESFSDWLRDKLSPRDEEERRQMETWLLQHTDQGKYDLHPDLKDRLSALPTCIRQQASDEPAIRLLAHPDDVAASLMRCIENNWLQEERSETTSLRREVKKRSSRVATGATTIGSLTKGQALGFTAMLLGMPTFVIAGSLYLSAVISSPALMTLGVITSASGFVLWMMSKRREISSLPVPHLKLWYDSQDSRLYKAPDAGSMAEIERRLLFMLPDEIRRKSAKAVFWSEVCYNMLERCDFHSALAASNHCLAADGHRLEGLLTRAISTGYFGRIQESYDALNKAFANHPFNRSMSWGLGWAIMLSGNWEDAELYLLKAAEYYLDSAVVHVALSQCQYRRGRLHEAISSAHRAVSLSADARLTLVNLLLEAGQPKNALAEIEAQGDMVKDNMDTMLQLVHANALCGNTDQSIALAAELADRFPGGKAFLRLAQRFYDAEQFETSQYYYEKALDCGFYPEALYTLSYLEYKKENNDRAHEMLTSALDCTREPGDGSVGPLVMLGDICSAMLTLDNEKKDCRAYQLTIDLAKSSADADSMTLLIYAGSYQDARKCAEWLYSTMYPGKELAESNVAWEDVEVDQPEAPVVPGIHGVRVA